MFNLVDIVRTYVHSYYMCMLRYLSPEGVSALLACQLYECIFVINGAPPLKITPVNSINRECLEGGVASNTAHTTRHHLYRA